MPLNRELSRLEANILAQPTVPYQIPELVGYRIDVRLHDWARTKSGMNIVPVFLATIDPADDRPPKHKAFARVCTVAAIAQLIDYNIRLSLIVLYRCARHVGEENQTDRKSLFAQGFDGGQKGTSSLDVPLRAPSNFIIANCVIYQDLIRRPRNA
jgi:hypothetical protein